MRRPRPDRDRSPSGAGDEVRVVVQNGRVDSLYEGRSPGTMVSPLAITTACSIAFSSSRTLPGHCCSRKQPHRLDADARYVAVHAGARTCEGSGRRAAECRRAARAAAARESTTTLSGSRDPRGTCRPRSCSSRSALVAAMTRTSTRDGLVGADALDLAFLQHAQQLHLQPAAAGRRSRRGTACRRRPPRRARRARSTAPVNAPRTWPNSSLSSRSLGNRRAVDGRRTGLPRAAELVDRARDQLLAGAALARDEHGGRVGATPSASR